MAVGIAHMTSVVGPAGLKGEPSVFETLVLALKEALGPSSGLTSDDVDVDYLTQLMRDYPSTDGGWESYAMGDSTRGYTRNLVDEGNGKSNLVGRHCLLYPTAC